MPTPTRPGCAGSSHPGRAGGSLAAREKELLAQQEIVPVLRDPTPGQQPTAVTIHRAQQYLDAEAAALRAGAEDPTSDELNTTPVDDIDAIKLILDERHRMARRFPLNSSTRMHAQLLAAQQVFENTKLERSDAWLLLANPDRISPAEHYRRDKLLHTHATPKDSPESITVALSTT